MSTKSTRRRAPAPITTRPGRSGGIFIYRGKTLIAAVHTSRSTSGIKPGEGEATANILIAALRASQNQ